MTNEKEPEIDVVDIDAAKIWKQYGSNDIINSTLKNATVTFTLMRSIDGTAWSNVNTTATKNSAANPITMTVGNSANEEAWKVSWTNLPKYEDVNGTPTLIQYKVVETEAKINTNAAVDDITPSENAAEVIIVDKEADYQEAVTPHVNPYAEGNLTNTLPSTEASVKKVWEGNGTPPESLTVTLLANGEGLNPEQKVTLSAPSWEDKVENLLKYNENGEEIDYTWKEETLPDGCFLTNESKTGTVTTLTNTFMEYDLKTSYVGTKIWSDEGNKYNTRPENLTVTLYKNNVATNLTPTWDKEEVTDQWIYTFSDLPVFDDNGDFIQYRAEEGSVGGYSSTTVTTATNYKIGQIHSESTVVRNHPDNQLVWSFYSQTDLPFLIVKQGHNYLLWTQRVATPDELALIKQWAESQSFYSSHVSYVSGIGDVTIGDKGTINISYVKTETGSQVTITFHNPSQWAQFARGAIAVASEEDAYSSGTSTFTNTLETTTLNGSKTWEISGTTVPDNPILTLTRTVTITTGEGDQAVTTTSTPEIVKVKQGETYVNLQPTWSGTDKNRTFTYTGLPAKDKNGNPYKYDVAEASFTIGTGVDAVTYSVVKATDGSYTVKADKEGAASFIVTQSDNDITNTETTDFEFTKEWHDLNGSVVAEWKTGTSITVNLQRKIGAEGNPESVGAYTITRTADGFSITSGEGKPAMTNVPNSFTFKVSGLAKYGTIESSTGEYAYFVMEEPMSEYNTLYSNLSPSGSNTNSYAINGGTIINTPVGGYELPQTGGIGTTLFTALGGLMTATAGAILTMKSYRRRKENA